MIYLDNTVQIGTKAMFDEQAFPKSKDFKLPKYTSVKTKESHDETNDEPSEFSEEESFTSKKDFSCPHQQRDQSPPSDGNGNADDPPEWPTEIPEVRPQGEPRRSGRQVKPPTRPGNVYGESKAPTQILREVSGEKTWSKAIGEKAEAPPKPKQKQKGNPGPSSAPPLPENVPLPEIPYGEVDDLDTSPGGSDTPGSDTSWDSEDMGKSLTRDYVIKEYGKKKWNRVMRRGKRAEAKERQQKATVADLVHDGGEDFANFLLAQAVPEMDSRKLPNKSPRDWTFRDLQWLPEAEQREWRKAMSEEIDALKGRRVFDLVELPHGRKAIKGRWVFDIKSDGRKRARYVAKGFSQIEGIDFEALFSPVVRYESVRFIFALAAIYGWYMTAVDAKTAFLYGKLDEEIYMEQPEGFHQKGQERKVYCLRRAIYGLKQAARAWWQELEKSVKKMGFVRLNADSGIFIFRSDLGVVILIAYVDDIIFFGKKLLADEKKAEFMLKWECQDLGTPTEFLSMRIRIDGDKISLDQFVYLEKVLERFGMTNAKAARTPMVEGYYPSEYTGPNNLMLTRKYQSVIGSKLLYLMLGTRPDIAYAVTKMAQHCANPTEEHLSKALYIMKYLAGSYAQALSNGQLSSPRKRRGFMEIIHSKVNSYVINRSRVYGTV
ncbi:hypothetical protein H1R20_g4172, partial [Candolleomyces eurysporus]